MAKYRKQCEVKQTLGAGRVGVGIRLWRQSQSTWESDRLTDQGRRNYRWVHGAKEAMPQLLQLCGA